MYAKEIPQDLFILPFKILIALCSVLGFDPLKVMNDKLILTSKKYSLENSGDATILEKMNMSKSLKRSHQC